MIKKVFKFLFKVLGMPYELLKYVLQVKNIKFLGKWFIDAIKESIAQIFTLLGFFIAWFTLTGTAQDIIGISIVISVIIWLVTIRLRD
jgi:hypothetical protein|tara:strand:- start:1795 stop:2058 length:264 start_codon:yes stop_codon:yes gene_type:complete